MAPINTLGLLMYGFGSGVVISPAIDGSGVVIRNEAMYFVSASSRWFRICVRSVIKLCSVAVLLGTGMKEARLLNELAYTIVKTLITSMPGTEPS
jgi:di/tricarboxylate transporter